MLLRYAELHCKTNFSFLEGASHADELVQRAVELGYAALAITDRNSLAGVVRAHTAAKQQGLKLIIGAEIVPQDALPVVLWASDRSAYGRLSRLITRGRRQAAKGDCRLTFADIAEHAEGLLAGVCPAIHLPTEPGNTSGNPSRPAATTSKERVPGAPHRANPHPKDPRFPTCQAEGWSRLRSSCHAYREVFGERGYLLVELHQGADDERWLAQLQQASRRTRLPLLAAGDVHYHTPARMPLHDVLTAVRHGVTVDEAGDRLFANAQRHLQPLEHIALALARDRQAIHRTLEVADRCHFTLDELRYEYPEELAPRGLTPHEYLQQLTWQGAARRYPAGIPAKVRGLLEHELQLIGELNYEAFFLTVWDLVCFARSRDILCQGRGSAANSAVCYCLGVTAVDPDRTDLLFERFVSRERDEAPDIDVDFEHERREEVLQYLYQKYGRDRAGLAAEVITYRCRSAIRDVGKALGFSLDRVDALAKQVEGYTHEPQLAQHCQQVGIDPLSDRGRRSIYLVNELIGFPRHLSQHVGGMVITRGPLCELVPIENAAMADRTVISWDKNDLEDLGILKVDCLALGMLTAIRKAFQLIETRAGRQLTLANIPEGDMAVYDLICQADTMGVFQIESRAQMSMLPRLRPRCYYDLVVEVAIVRPGPIQGQMVHPYLRRRMGVEAVSYPSEAIRAVLEKTLGVPIFQEQAMRLAVVAAGFTPGEADQLRRAMGAWRRPGIIDEFRQKLLQGMLARGLSPQFAEQVFLQIRGFGEYGFPESHAASFALLVYVSAWLKRHYPAAFTAALINSQPMGFYAPAQLVRDACQHGVTVRPVDINFSNWDCTLETDRGDRWVLRLGLRLIHGLPRTAVTIIQQARGSVPFGSLQDFTRRTGLGRAIIMRLSDADAFASLGRERRRTLWEALAQNHASEALPLFQHLPPEDDPVANLPALQPLDEVFADYQTTGLSLKAHPLSFYRSQLQRLGVVPATRLAELRDRQLVRVAGLVLLRQRPGTAKGITFVTLEDETGTANLVIHQNIWQRFYTIARRSPAWITHGRLEIRQTVIHVVVSRLEDLGQSLRKLEIRSRDFR